MPRYSDKAIDYTIKVIREIAINCKLSAELDLSTVRTDDLCYFIAKVIRYWETMKRYDTMCETFPSEVNSFFDDGEVPPNAEEKAD